MWGGHHKAGVRCAGPRLSRGKHPWWKARGSTQRTSPAGKLPGLSKTIFLSGQEGHSEPVAPWQTGGGPLSMKQNPIWMNGCLGGEPVHCQMLVLSGKGSQSIKKEEKRLGRKRIRVEFAPDSSQSGGGGQANALPQHQGGGVEPRCSE